MCTRLKAISGQLHELEEELIQITGLMNALQKVQPDDGLSTCIANSIEERLKNLRCQFYQHWDTVIGQQ